MYHCTCSFFSYYLLHFLDVNKKQDLIISHPSVLITTLSIMFTPCHVLGARVGRFILVPPIFILSSLQLNLIQTILEILIILTIGVYLRHLQFVIYIDIRYNLYISWNSACTLTNLQSLTPFYIFYLINVFIVFFFLDPRYWEPQNTCNLS